jgi:RHH-type transcriptional regulator, rel operon repressor / antitoxin RelB
MLEVIWVGWFEQAEACCCLRYVYCSAIILTMPMSLRLPAQVQDRLTALSTLTGRSKTFYATEAIIEYIDDLEDAHLSSEIRARVRAGTEASIPLSELLDEYGLAR